MKVLKFLSHPAFFVTLCVYFVMGYLTLGMGNRMAGMLFDEDRYFENVGAISLFAASAISFYNFYLVRKTHKLTGIFWGKQLVYLGLAVLYFFGGGEEISWGQRIFNIHQPEILKENVQGELNIHNLAFFENSYYLKSDDIFSIFWFGFAIVVPAASLMSSRIHNLASRWLPIIHWSVGALFLFNYLMAKLAKTFFEPIYKFSLVPFVQAVQEIKESNYELMFVFLSLYVLWDFFRQFPPESPS